MGYLISDPLGDGSDIFGTAGHGIDYNVISGSAHLVRAGGRARVRPRRRAWCSPTTGRSRPTRTPREATRSQYWMLVVMVGFTSLGLWLLSAVSR